MPDSTEEIVSDETFMTPEAFLAWREEFGWTQTEAGRQLGKKIRMIQRYEHGEASIPRYIQLSCWALRTAPNLLKLDRGGIMPRLTLDQRRALCNLVLILEATVDNFERRCDIEGPPTDDRPEVLRRIRDLVKGTAAICEWALDRETTD